MTHMKRWITGLGAALALTLASPAALADHLGTNAVVHAEWVAEQAAAGKVVVLDARSDRIAYDRGHIPGAVFTHYGRDGWRVVRDGVPGMLPEPAALEKLIGGLGIGNDDHVVVVAPGNGATDMGIATRIYWTFKVLGHDRVAVMDGGMKGYLAAGLPLSMEPVRRRPTGFKADFRPEHLATRDDVRNALAAGGALVDNRPPAQFTGKSKSRAAMRFGTIPGAGNAPAVAMTEPGGGYFLAPDALAEFYAAVGAPAGDGAVTFCNTGHWASVGWFVQSEIMGRKNVRMYDGSISDWSRDPGNPMVRRAY